MTSILLLKRLSKMNKVKAHTLRKYEEAKLVEELTTHRVSDDCTAIDAYLLIMEWSDEFG